MQTIARFVTRASDPATGKVDLIIGSAMKSETALKPNTIYELVELLGALVFQEVGPSAIGDTRQTSLYMDTGWANPVEHVLDHAGSRLMLTRTEMQEHLTSLEIEL